MLKKIWALWAPGALDHGPYGPQGPWAQITKKIEIFKILQKLLLRTSNDP